MFRYFLYRLFIAIPTLIAVSLIAFGLSKIAPGDPVLRSLVSDDMGGFEGVSGRTRFEKEYTAIAKNLNLDKPNFYISLQPAPYPDTLHRIVFYERRQTLKKLLDQHGDWPLVSTYYHGIKTVETALLQLPSSVDKNVSINLRRHIRQLRLQYKTPKISDLLSKMQQQAEKDSLANIQLIPPIRALITHFQSLQSQSKPHRLYWPSIRWNGLDNQYHLWWTSFILGDFGKSFVDGRPVMTKIWEAAYWTILLNLISITLAYLIAVPIGIRAAIGRGKWFDRVSSFLLFSLYSLPTFWIATLLVVFFTTPEYGRWTDIFPSIGLGSLPQSAPFWDRFWESASHLILPIICLTYRSLAFIARQMRGSLLEVIQQDYIRTARAKGLGEKIVILRHALRNALFPLITLFALVFPSMIGGAIIVEIIFNIPGMGLLTFNAIVTQDWPIVFTIVMLFAILTIIGNLAADFLFAAADPRVKLDR